MDCSLSGSSVHGVLQARMLEWIAMPSSRESFPPRDGTPISYVFCIDKQGLYHWYHLGMKDFISTVSCTSGFWWSLHLCTPSSSTPWGIMSIGSPQIQGTWLLLLPWAEQEPRLPGSCTCNSSELTWAEELSGAKHKEPWLSKALLQSPVSLLDRWSEREKKEGLRWRAGDLPHLGINLPLLPLLNWQVDSLSPGRP